MRNDLKRDVPLVHGRESSIAHVSELIDKTGHSLQGSSELVVDRLENGLGVVMLLEGDERGGHCPVSAVWGYRERSGLTG